MIAVHRVFGAVSQIRTGDLFLTKEVLYLLSYNSIKIERLGFENSTFISPINHIALCGNGARGGVRTRDTQIKSLVLYQLSYTSIAKEVIADTNAFAETSQPLF